MINSQQPDVPADPLDRDESLVRETIAHLGIDEYMAFAIIGGARYIGVYPGLALRLDGKCAGIGPTRSTAIDALMSSKRDSLAGAPILASRSIKIQRTDRVERCVCVSLSGHTIQARYYAAVSLLWPKAKWELGSTHIVAVCGKVPVAIAMLVIA